VPDPITKKRKKHLRNLPRNSSGRGATVKMATYTGGKNNKRNFAAPTITFKGNETLEAGEVYEFKSKKRAERFAAGSWKKGKEKRTAMAKYRAKKKQDRIDKRNG
jgi:hypothetical protein